MTNEQIDLIESIARQGREGVNLDCGQASTPSSLNCSPPPLAFQVKKGLEHAAQESWRLGQHQELNALLQKNPDVARILDLIKILGY